jgi:twitching motility protein PilJ
LVERAERNAGVVMGQQKILTQVGDALRTINRQSADLLAKIVERNAQRLGHIDVELLTVAA